MKAWQIDRFKTARLCITISRRVDVNYYCLTYFKLNMLYLKNIPQCSTVLDKHVLTSMYVLHLCVGACNLT